MISDKFLAIVKLLLPMLSYCRANVSLSLLHVSLSASLAQKILYCTCFFVPFNGYMRSESILSKMFCISFHTYVMYENLYKTTQQFCI